MYLLTPPQTAARDPAYDTTGTVRSVLPPRNGISLPTPSAQRGRTDTETPRHIPTLPWPRSPTSYRHTKQPHSLRTWGSIHFQPLSPHSPPSPPPLRRPPRSPTCPKCRHHAHHPFPHSHPATGTDNHPPSNYPNSPSPCRNGLCEPIRGYRSARADRAHQQSYHSTIPSHNQCVQGKYLPHAHSPHKHANPAAPARLRRKTVRPMIFKIPRIRNRRRSESLLSQEPITLTLAHQKRSRNRTTHRSTKPSLADSTTGRKAVTSTNPRSPTISETRSLALPSNPLSLSSAKQNTPSAQPTWRRRRQRRNHANRTSLTMYTHTTTTPPRTCRSPWAPDAVPNGANQGPNTPTKAPDASLPKVPAPPTTSPRTPGA